MTSIQDALGRLWQADDGANMLQSGGHWISWGRIRTLAEQLDEQLSAAGCGAGGRVAVVLGNRMESVAALIAIMRGERTLVTISPLQPVERLSSDLLATKAAFVLAPAALWVEDTFTSAMAELGAAAWSVDDGALVKRSELTCEPPAGEPKVAVEMLTSGTTGAPKRIPLSRAQLEASLSAALQHNNRPDGSERAPFTGKVGLVVLPIVHIGGLWGLLQALVTARPFVMLERFNLPAWRAVVNEHRPALISLPPPALRAVLDSDITREELGSVRAVNVGTSPAEPALVDAFYEKFGIPVLIVYGATEFSGAVAGWTKKDFVAHWSDKKGSTGRPFPGVRLQVIDDDGNVLPTGETGRLQVASPQVGGSSDRWVTTSDLAHLDEDGYLYIDGRADDVILRGGFKIAPDTVARALRTHDAVHDAAVAGLPDTRLGQIPIAAVELRPGTSVTPEQLRSHCRSSLTPYEVPAEVHVVDELPRGAALKVDRRRLTAMLEELRQDAPAANDRFTRESTKGVLMAEAVVTADAVAPAAALVEVRSNVMIITINRPEARNAVNGAVSTAVGDAMVRAQQDPEIRAVVITGAGDKSFCAGADLKAISRGESVLHPHYQEWSFAGYANHFIDKPTIAAVNGTALGGGTELAFASDLVVACESASFGLPEVKRGLIAGAGGAFRIVDQLPPKVGLGLLFTGDPMTAAEALRWGLINEVVPDGPGNPALKAALALANRIAVNAPLSVQASKRIAYRADDGVMSNETADWSRTAHEFDVLLKSEDAKEGPLAFGEKRQPVWKAR